MQLDEVDQCSIALVGFCGQAWVRRPRCEVGQEMAIGRALNRRAREAL
jgi:hypothetical protein